MTKSSVSLVLVSCSPGPCWTELEQLGCYHQATLFSWNKGTSTEGLTPNPLPWASEPSLTWLTAERTRWKGCVVIWIPKPCVDKIITINIIIYQSTEWQTEDAIPHIGPHEKSQIKSYLHDSLQRCCLFRDSLWRERHVMLMVWFM